MVEFDAQEVFDWAFKVHVEVSFGVDKGFELRFYFLAFTKVDEVIDIEPDVDGRLTLDDGSSEYAGEVWEGIEANEFEGFCCCFVPVAGAAF